MSKAVVFFAEGTEECEALLVVDLLRRAKVEVTIASATGNRAITSSHKVHITAAPQKACWPGCGSRCCGRAKPLLPERSLPVCGPWGWTRAALRRTPCPPQSISSAISSGT